MRVVADEDMNLGRTKKTIGVRIPAMFTQNAIARRCQGHEISGARTRHEANRCLSRQIEQFEEPPGRDFLNRGGGRGWRMVPGILASGAREPVCGDACRMRPSENPAKEARMHHRHQTRFALLGQLADDLLSICAGFRQRFREIGPHFMIIAHWHAWSTGGGRPIFDGLVKRFAKRV